MPKSKLKHKAKKMSAKNLSEYASALKDTQEADKKRKT
jgi:hypothetical protein